MGLGIAFAGGGLKGTAYIGVIKALDELNVRPEYISGTSSGSLFALMYALGYTADEIKSIFLDCYEKIIKIKKLPIGKAMIRYAFTKENSLKGMIDGEELENIVSDVVKEKGIVNMKDIKNLAFATVDAKTTKECFLWTGDEKREEDFDYISDISIGKAVRASMSFPAAFTPCPFRDYIFIDGGTKDNLPIEILRKMGAEKTISNFIDTILRACDIFSYRDVLNAQKSTDCVVEIALEQAKLLSIENIDDAIKTGYDTIMKQKKKILELKEVKA